MSQQDQVNKILEAIKANPASVAADLALFRARCLALEKENIRLKADVQVLEELVELGVETVLEQQTRIDMLREAVKIATAFLTPKEAPKQAAPTEGANHG